MKLVYDGKSKSVYELENGQYLLHFKDDVARESERMPPGSSFVLGELKDKGRNALRISRYFFELLGRNNIPSHYIEADLENNWMAVKKAKTFGRGLEVICWFKAYGSFLERYGAYVQEFQPLGGLVEITLKDDERGDPLINDEALVELGLLQPDELEEVKAMARRIAGMIRDDLATRGLELAVIKLEFGRVDNRIVIIDDIAGEHMRVFRKGAEVLPRELTDLLGD